MPDAGLQHVVCHNQIVQYSGSGEQDFPFHWEQDLFGSQFQNRSGFQAYCYNMKLQKAISDRAIALLFCLL